MHYSCNRGVGKRKLGCVCVCVCVWASGLVGGRVKGGLGSPESLMKHGLGGWRSVQQDITQMLGGFSASTTRHASVSSGRADWTHTIITWPGNQRFFFLLFFTSKLNRFWFDSNLQKPLMGNKSAGHANFLIDKLISTLLMHSKEANYHENFTLAVWCICGLESCTTFKSSKCFF